MTTPTLTDLKTSEGARRYLADYFSSVIGNHFFKDYISEALAADFACTLSQHLAALAAQPELPEPVAVAFNPYTERPSRSMEIHWTKYGESLLAKRAVTQKTKLYTAAQLQQAVEAAKNSTHCAKPELSADVQDALNYVDDFIARCNGDDRGSCLSVNVLRRALLQQAQAKREPIPNEDGWVASHPKYGEWFYPKSGVIASWREYEEHFDPASAKEQPSEDSIETWVAEQFGWSEVKLYGTQLSAIPYSTWLAQANTAMAHDTDIPDSEAHHHIGGKA